MPLWFVIQGTKPGKRHTSYGWNHQDADLIRCLIQDNMLYDKLLTWIEESVILIVSNKYGDINDFTHIYSQSNHI